RMLFPDTGLPWVLPAPNKPMFDTAVVYPGQVLLEGTSLSEGRGTTRPLEIFGAPWLDTRAVASRFDRRRLPGLVLREHPFEPTFQKWAGNVCQGFQIQVTDVGTFRPYLTTLALLQDIIAEHRDRFEWKQPPYEYVTARLLIDALSVPLLIAIVSSGLVVFNRILPLQPEWDRAFDILFDFSIVLALVMFVDRATRGVLDRFAAGSAVMQGARGLIQAGVRGVAIGIGILIFLDSIGISITPILASLGVGSLAVALALQDNLANLFAGLYMI